MIFRVDWVHITISFDRVDGLRKATSLVMHSLVSYTKCTYYSRPPWQQQFRYKKLLVSHHPSLRSVDQTHPSQKG